jgi:hypothetical protein
MDTHSALRALQSPFFSQTDGFLRVGFSSPADEINKIKMIAASDEPTVRPV